MKKINTILSLLILFSFNNIRSAAAAADEAGQWAEAERHIFMDAVCKGDTGTLRALIDIDVDVNFHNAKAQSPLMLAARNGDHDVVDLLLEAKAAVNRADASGYTPLMFAVTFQENPTTVARLVQAKASLNSTNNKGSSPLIIAATNGQVDSTRVLINAQADVLIVNNNDDDALLAIADNLAIPEEIKLQIIQLLVVAKSDIDRHAEEGETALRSLIYQRNKSIAIFLINAKANISARECDSGETALMTAIARHSAEDSLMSIAQLLLSRKASVNPQNMDQCDNPLTIAAGYGNKPMVVKLLELKAEVEHQGLDNRTPLMTATIGGDTEIMEILLHAKANIDAKNEYKDTALSIAKANDNSKAVKLLQKYMPDASPGKRARRDDQSDGAGGSTE